MSLNSQTVSLARQIGEYIEAIHGGTITAPALSQRFHIHPSHVRGCINYARMMGIPICSNAKGYFYSLKKEDVEATIEHMERRMEQQRKAIQGLRQVVNV